MLHKLVGRPRSKAVPSSVELKDGSFANSELRGLLAQSTYETPPTLDTRARVALFYDAQVPHEEIQQLGDSEICYDMLMRRGIPMRNVLLAGLDCVALRCMGCETVEQLRAIKGMDALVLVGNVEFAASAFTVWDAFDLRDAFLRNGEDAVALAGSSVAERMALGSYGLLAVCAEDADSATAVLQQLDSYALQGLPCQALVKTGISAEQLKRTGYSLNHVLDGCSPATSELVALGFRF